MARTNIIFFTGANRIFLRRDLDRWIEVFASKYGEYNIARFDRDALEKTNIVSELATPVFLGEKRLIVLEWVPAAGTSDKSEKKDDEKEEKRNVDDAILAVLDSIPDTTFVLFVEATPDKRRVLYKRLLELATVKDYPVLEGRALHDYVRNSLPHLDVSAIGLLLEYTGSDMLRLESEMQKLALYKIDGWITEDDIRSCVTPSIESSIFVLTDALFVLDAKKALRELDRILDSGNIHQVFATVLGSLRNYLYVQRLLQYGYPADEIRTNLKIHPFVFEKLQKSSRVIAPMNRLFETLVDLDRRAKTGEGIGDTDDALLVGLQKAILHLQK